MTIEQRVAVLEEIFAKLQDYYTSAYSGEEIDARLASAGVPIGITKEYKSVAEMNQDFTGTDVQRGQFVLILPDSTASADYGKVYLKGTANWVYAFTLNTLTSIKGPIGPPGKKGDKGDPGEAGSSFVILGYFDTLDALKAAVPNPKAGDVYGVGTAPPYNIYIWDSVHGKWVGNGNLQGPQGEQGIQGPEGKRGPEGKQGPEGPVGGSSNFVRYDAAQSLTDEQKAQARTNIGADTVQGAVLYTPQSLTDDQKTQARSNIGAAPSGYGYGETIQRIGHDNITDAEFVELLEAKLSTMDYNSAAQVTWVDHPLISGTTFVGTLWKSGGGEYAVLTGSSYSSLSLIRVKQNNVWQPFEWVNPPMVLGQEYRTTEKYSGNPVYTKLVDCGALPNATRKTVNHGATVEYMLRCAANCTAGYKDSLPYWYDDNDYCTVYASTTQIIFKTPKDLSDRTANAQIWYTKPNT